MLFRSLLDSICGNFLDGGFAIALERTVRAEIAISAFGTSFSAAEISISAAVKTTGAAPAGLFPIASQPSTNRLAFVLMAEVRRPGSQETQLVLSPEQRGDRAYEMMTCSSVIKSISRPMKVAPSSRRRLVAGEFE